MPTMRSRTYLPLIFLLTACAGATPPPEVTPLEVATEVDSAVLEEPAPADDLHRELEDATVALDLARLRAEVAEVELAHELVRIEQDAAEQEQALTHFRETAVPIQIEDAAINLQQMQNSLRETEEEMAQLEMMYGADELTDKTAEIVLERTRRRLELQRRWLEIAQREFALLREHEIPLELLALEKDLEDARLELRTATLSAKISRMEQRQELGELERAVIDLKTQLAETEGAEVE